MYFTPDERNEDTDLQWLQDLISEEYASESIDLMELDRIIDRIINSAEEVLRDGNVTDDDK